MMTEYVQLNKADRIWIAYQIRDSSLTEQTKQEMLKKLNNPIGEGTIRMLGDNICKERYHGDSLVNEIRKLTEVAKQ